MNERRPIRTMPIFVGILCVAIGLAIGLFIGWVLWPVQWEGGTLEHVDQAIREDYLRAAIDSYTLNQDASLATQRYNSLGDYKEPTLATIYLEPGTQTQVAIASFAAAVKATEVLAASTIKATQEPGSKPLQPTPAKPQGVLGVISMPLLASLCALILLLGLLAVIFLILQRRSRAAPAEETLPPVPETPEAAVVAETPPAEIPSAELTPSDELPDWLQKPAIEKTTRHLEPEETGIPGAVAGIGVAALAGAAVLSTRADETLPPPETIPVASTLPPFEPTLPEETLPVAETPIETLAPVMQQAVIESEPPAAAAPEAPFTAGEEQIPESKAKTAPLPKRALQEEAQGVVSEPPAVETAEQIYDKFGRPIEYIEGVGEAYGQKLRGIGITAPLLLLKNGATSQGRREIAVKTGISEKLILKWVNQVDLYRIKGIAQEYAELLEVAGVDTVKELALRNPQNLHQKLLEVGKEKQLVRRPPALSQVENWITQAKKLPRVVSY
jgi:predicted flap endonuclease-1-like 5' DNA nuclease